MTTPDTSRTINPEAHLSHAHSTDVGLRRDENQDAFGVLTHQGSAIYIVADGMGGTQGGAIASSVAVDIILSEITKIEDLDRDSLIASVKTANDKVYKKSLDEPDLRGMGTTVVGLIFKEDHLHILNVGDSRAYRIRDGEAKCITKDHTLLTELIRTGAITEDQADNHPVSHMLTRSLGPTDDLDVDCWVYEYGPAAGDYYLICSDGLYNQVKEDEIAEIVSSHSLDEAVEELVKRANSKGGPDNITVILVRVKDNYPKSAEDYVDVSLEHDEPPTLELENSIVEEATRSLLASNSASYELSKLNGEPDTHVQRIQRKFFPDLMVNKQYLLPLVVLGAVLVGYLLATPMQNEQRRQAQVSKSSAAKPDSPSAISESIKTTDSEVNPIQDELEPQSLLSRREQISEELKYIDRSISALDYAESSEAQNFIEVAQVDKKSLSKELSDINIKIDESNRDLARWYGRRKRLDSQNALNTAAELAGEIPELGAIKRELDQMTWRYLQSIEQKDAEAALGMTSEQLAAKRKALVAGLISASVTQADKQIETIQYQAAELTVKREKIEKDTASLSREIDFAKLSVSDDPRAKNEQRKLLERERYELEQEQEKINKLIEMYGS